MASPDRRLVRQIAARQKIVAASSKRRTRKRAPRAAPPSGIARDYMRALVGLLEPLADITMKRLEAVLPDIVEAAPLPRADAASTPVTNMIARTMSGLRVEYAERVTRVRRLAETAGEKTAAHNRRETNRQFRSVLGIDLPGQDPFLAEQLELFREENVALVTRMTEEELAKIEATLRAAARSGARVEEIRAQLEERLGVSRSRAQLIARDQVLKLNGELTQLRQREAGIDEYEWVTSGDAAVRPRHAHLNGKIFKWSEPPIVDLETGRRAHPGEDYQCRCTANPIIRIPD